ncbi:hypothetical protein PIB30_019766 [Stylosanthes scabra]|uniref:non-specific serine/threonine protein kinase n=1 Tax=Stylosanthes scabra TaxID=79078 RepID=A0ABU6X5T2_9FABA|nr:hypothetical protein [Stylosanthes scabra]
MQSDSASSSCKEVVQSQPMEPAQVEKQISEPSPSVDSTNESSPKKLGNKASVPKNGRKGRLQSSSSTSANGNRVSKQTRNAPRTVKMVIKNKGLGKKKLKQGSGSASCDPRSNDVNNKPAPLVCERCLCAIENKAKGNSQDIESIRPGDGVNSSSARSGLVSTSCNSGREITEVKKNTRLKEQLEFSQSSKSSQGDYSSSTSTSDESNVSGSTCGNRPHMSKDVRWEAIRHAQMRHGVLGLRHFNLLKKLGCGDIGTVYLAELIGTNCLFAIKVMDNEFLARRKKMPRAQTEREILRILDHPFLPTMYAQFTSDNLACLVMEYCPGGDLHVLRQKQLGRSFSEPAARFYVAEVLLALEYLHMLGIVYRDLKPENILVREDGHIMLTDFDLSLRCDVSPTLLKQSSDMDPAKVSGPCVQSNCIEPFCIEPVCQVPCFSPRFLPPAAKARKQKAELAAQIRSLPQLVAEPTDARSNSFVGTHEYLAPEIIKGEGHGAAEPENRLGTEKGAAEIKQHPFFEGLNWALIRCATPPEVPDLCEFEFSEITSQSQSHGNKGGKYLECKTTGEQVEFELF